MTAQHPSLRVFERQVTVGERQEALQTALEILDSINDRYGGLDHLDLDELRSRNTNKDFTLVFCTRFAASLGRLLVDPKLVLSSFDYECLLLHHRWIDLIFRVSGFRNSDHFLRLLGQADGNKTMGLAGANLPRFLAMLTPNSPVSSGIDFEKLWKADQASAATAFLSYLRSRYVFRPRAFAFRERLLEWLPDRLNEVKLGGLALSRLQDLYMHCSYAITPRKHAIKGALIAQMHRACLDAGVEELEQERSGAASERPTIIIACEQISSNHSIYRTHSLAIQALRKRFNTVGFVFQEQISPEIDALFDETIAFPKGEFFKTVRKASEEIRRRSPAAIFFPSVGMQPHTIALASLRLAPIQCASYGHAASTKSPAIDYMILPEDFAGSPDCFSEKLIALPGSAMPFRPPHLLRPDLKAAAERKSDGKIRVGIPSSTMKLNPKFFQTLKQIGEKANTPVEFQFFPLASVGLAQTELTRVVRETLPSGIVFRHAPFEEYLENLSRCDFILCPFPYGNTNSIVDSVLVGLPGICLDGPEPHSHIDAGLFHRMGQPDQLTTKSTDDYILEAVKMIDDEEWRVHCRKIVANCDLDEAFFRDDSNLFCDAIAKLVWPNEGPGATAAG